MSYRNHCNTLNERHYTGGRDNLIADLIRDGSHRLEAWGNAREGFTLYLTSAADAHSSGCQISSGAYTLRRDLVAACRRTYGDGVKVFNGRNW